MVVDGSGETQGASEGPLRALAERAAQKSKLRIALTRRDNVLSIAIDGQISVAESSSSELWLALLSASLSRRR